MNPELIDEQNIDPRSLTGAFMKDVIASATIMLCDDKLKMPEVRLIDANALIYKRCSTCCLRKTCANRYEKDGKQYVCGDIKDILNAPTVEAEPVRHGRWENGECTNCKRNLLDLCCGEDYELARYAEYDADFCPFCGAKMHGGVENG